MQKAKWLSEEALQISEKWREVRSKGEKERYTHLNAEFQRIARRDKKALLSDQWKEMEENKRMGKTRDFFKKIRDTKGTFQAKMGSIKDRNGRDLTEAEDIKKTWQEYKELCSPLWTKLMEVMEFQLNYFNPKRWYCESAALNILANLENSAVSIGLEKVSFHSNPKERQCQRMLKLLHNCTHLTC